MSAVEKPFLMCVEDVFHLNQGRLVMPTGRIERGRVRRGDDVEIVGFGSCAVTHVTDIETGRLRVGEPIRRRVDEASAGMHVGLLLPGAAAGAIERGVVLAAPRSIEAYSGFAADIALLSEEEGGAEIRTGDCLCFYIRAAAVCGAVTLPRGTDVLHPLHQGAVTVMLEQPVALEEGHSFPFRYRGRAAGSGTVTQLLR
ncbi:EF-Tu/IF-2/RF-3 family GTPase [Streptomyces sp. NPDC001339]|uniref:EF-Tu C-terminal domain-related protein n=1 Tax=Streptomyces sp. NPDC001339 TaxID=3364563 RepID=UPI0036B832D5